MTFKEAIDKNDFEYAKTMINNGEDILQSQFQFNLSDTFTKLVRQKAFDVLNALIEYNHIELDIFEYDNFNNSIFDELVRTLDNSPESLEFLANFISQVENLNDSLEDQTWLTLALNTGAKPEIVQTMIDNGCDINYIDRNGRSLLHTAADANQMKVNPQKRVAYFNILIENGLDVNRKTEYGETVLNIIMNQNDMECAQLLIDNGADPNVPNKQGKTAYHTILVDQGNFQMAQKIAESYPPDFEAETGQETDLFFDYLNSYTVKKEHLGFFADNGANPDKIHKDAYGTQKTPLDIAVEKDAEFFEAFIHAFSPDINQADDNGNTLLHKVCEYNVNFDQTKAKDIYRKAKLLIKLGADTSIRNTSDLTAADLAGQDNLKEKTVALLLKA